MNYWNACLDSLAVMTTLEEAVDAVDTLCTLFRMHEPFNFMLYYLEPLLVAGEEKMRWGRGELVSKERELQLQTLVAEAVAGLRSALAALNQLGARCVGSWARYFSRSVGLVRQFTSMAHGSWRQHAAATDLPFEVRSDCGCGCRGS